jgi:CRP-like cAMP-binding protein
MKNKPLSDLMVVHPFFEGMDRSHVDFIAGCAENRRFKAGQFMMLMGKDAQEFYMIRSGRVAVEMDAGNRTYNVQTIGEGGIIGWSWLHPPLSTRYDVRVIEDVSAFAFNAQCVREKCEADHEFGFNITRRFMKLVIERLMATRVQLAELYA